MLITEKDNYIDVPLDPRMVKAPTQLFHVDV